MPSRSAPFGQRTADVNAYLARLGKATPEEIGLLAEYWHPSLEYLAAGAMAWKIARKTKTYGEVQNAYDAPFFALPKGQADADWQQAISTAGNAAMAIALGKRLPADAWSLLMAGVLAAFPDWEEREPT